MKIQELAETIVFNILSEGASGSVVVSWNRVLQTDGIQSQPRRPEPQQLLS
jgi:hypothetical protein